MSARIRVELACDKCGATLLTEESLKHTARFIAKHDNGWSVRRENFGKESETMIDVCSSCNGNKK